MSPLAPPDLVPVIDISGFVAGTDLETAPRLIREAATTTGFFQVVGHGIDPAHFDAAYAVAEVLMALPEEVKATLGSPSGHPYRGLMRNYDKQGALVSEGFTIARFDGPDDARAHGVPEEYLGFFVENVWPPVEGFADAMGELARHTRGVGRQLMSAFALALDLPADHFDEGLVLDTTTSTIRSYPPHRDASRTGESVVFDSHFDGGMLTLLHQRGTYDGLQILAQDGEWYTVPTDDAAFVINIGELMHRWTNGRWPATRHRVVSASDPDGHRFTLPTFYRASVDTVVAPLETQIGPEGALFEPVTVLSWEGRHILSSFREREHTSAHPASEAYVARLEAAVGASRA
ncbi:isopenicillin N synthase family oxygenase [Blastococcus sp. TF02A-26]|uniref:isopenicillin N synthase family dioxygenase n=1 Tax=Blastococcus sp. TF02A-26 TaxID=2250577 RepID=UPI000DE99A32|nr:2OG-Fe(II) oxygenase family protein [Blastococcus sp. TF02A-26]RBY86816.1 isopenicillin N synthase family oxygenase [Blastococcus sp. TF02A-26]